MGTSTLTRCKALFRFRALKRNNSKFLTSLRFSSTTINKDGSSSLRGRAYDALMLDAGGTLLQLAKPVEETYASIGTKYGLNVTPAEIKQGFKRAFSAPWPEKLRYQGDGRPFWKLVVSEATGCSDEDYFEEVYETLLSTSSVVHYSTMQKVMRGIFQMELMKQLLFSRMLEVSRIKYSFFFPYLINSIVNLKNCLPSLKLVLANMTSHDTVKMAVVSNFDSRLRKLLRDLNVLNLFDAVIISSEVGYEKPDPRIFQAALDQVKVEACKALHIGDDQKADKHGANAVGIDCWLWGVDVKSFSEIQIHMLNPNA